MIQWRPWQQILGKRAVIGVIVGTVVCPPKSRQQDFARAFHVTIFTRQKRRKSSKNDTSSDSLCVDEFMKSCMLETKLSRILMDFELFLVQINKLSN
jgi:hypothetical protein